jgi:hypothetical protein
MNFPRKGKIKLFCVLLTLPSYKRTKGSCVCVCVDVDEQPSGTCAYADGAHKAETVTAVNSIKLHAKRDGGAASTGQLSRRRLLS